MNMLLTIFLVFAKIGLFTFGGGYAMISIIEDICVSQKKWITHEEMMNMTVVAESTPGPIAINCATFIGYKQKGLAGAIAATLGMIIPSFVIIYLISMFLDNFMKILWIANAFKGIRIAVGILIVDAAIKMIRKMKMKAFSITIIICSVAVMLLKNFLDWNFTSITIMLVAGILSLVIFTIKNASSKKGGAAE